MLSFGDFCLDRRSGVLTRHGEAVLIRRKVWQVLRYLTERPGVLVSTEELLAHAWPGTQVAANSVASVISELRKLLDEQSAKLRFIETVPGRGFRFVAPIVIDRGSSTDESFVGRSADMAVLETAWDEATRGKRRVVLVAGDAGIGKTTLVERFLRSFGPNDLRAGDATAPLVLEGRCRAERPAAEAYRPFLDMLESWGLEVDADAALALLRRHAPHWLPLVGWASADEPALGVLAALEASPARMQREAASFLEAASHLRPLVLTFEDLHWSDPTTIDLIAALADRPAAARLLVVGTYRPTEAALLGHPVTTLLGATAASVQKLILEPLRATDVRQCLERIFSGGPMVVECIADTVQRVSGGNPLFVHGIARQLIAGGWVRRNETGWEMPHAWHPDQVELPSELTEMIARLRSLLDAKTRKLLEAASVVGAELDAAAVAAAVNRPLEKVDAELQRCAKDAGLVEQAGVSAWPNGTTGGRYRFTHPLVQRVLYDSMPASRRARKHRAIAGAIEEGFRATPAVVVTTLAEHYSAGGDHSRAADYLERAANQMIVRAAHREALGYCQRAIEHLRQLPDDIERWTRELRLCAGLGITTAWVTGPASPVLRQILDRAEFLRVRVVDPAVLLPTLRLLWLNSLVRFDFASMTALSAQFLARALETGDAAYLGPAYALAGATECYFGRQKQARSYLEEAVWLCDSVADESPPEQWGMDMRVEARCYLAWVLWLLGYPQQSATRIDEARTIAEQGGHGNTRVLALWFTSSLAQLRRDRLALYDAADRLDALAGELDNEVWVQVAATMRAVARLEDGKPDALSALIASISGSGENPTMVVARSYLLGQLAAAYGREGNAEQGLSLVQMALANISANGARVSESDLLRIQGELLESRGDENGADDTFGRAIAVAQEQSVLSFELRAVLARARLLEKRGRGSEARALLRSVYDKFSEGSNTTDLVAARCFPDL